MTTDSHIDSRTRIALSPGQLFALFAVVLSAGFGVFRVLNKIDGVAADVQEIRVAQRSMLVRLERLDSIERAARSARSVRRR